MRHSAVYQVLPESRLFPTACPWCRASRLAYQYENGACDAYQCQQCRKWALVRDVEGNFGWRREIRRLTR